MQNELDGQIMMGEVANIMWQGKNERYKAFVDKFKDVKTTDDCYTPPAIYEAVAAWVAAEYGIERERFVRPFRPDGDYQAEEYPQGCAVVDNPPFSILAQIVDWYLARGIRFFLFGPTLTLLNLMKKPERKEKICILLLGNDITYENGAEVLTSYVTNMDTYALRIEADLRARLEDINKALTRKDKKALPKYTYPDYVLTGKEYRLAKYGQTLRIRHEDCVGVDALDAQREQKKNIFGGGLLLSEEAAAERAAAEREADRAAASAQGKGPDGGIKWQLSAREKAVIRNMRG